MGGVAAAGRASVDCPRAHRSHEPAAPNRRPQHGEMGRSGRFTLPAHDWDHFGMVVGNLANRIRVGLLDPLGEFPVRMVGQHGPDARRPSREPPFFPTPALASRSQRQPSRVDCHRSFLAAGYSHDGRCLVRMARGREIPPPRPRGRVPRVRLRPGRACGGIIVPGVRGGPDCVTSPSSARFSGLARS